MNLLQSAAYPTSAVHRALAGELVLMLLFRDFIGQWCLSEAWIKMYCLTKSSQNIMHAAVVIILQLLSRQTMGTTPKMISHGTSLTLLKGSFTNTILIVSWGHQKMDVTFLPKGTEVWT